MQIRNTVTVQEPISLCSPEIRGNEWTYLKECLDTGWVSSVGSFVDRFEEVLATEAGTRYAVATVNGTAALHTSLIVAGIQPNDEVLVSTVTFIAPVNAIRYVGAWPVFIDAEQDYWQMDPAKVIEFLEHRCEWRQSALFNRTTGRRVRAVLPVHVLGHPVDLDPILEIARKYDLTVIEDASEGLGAHYKNRPIGGLADIGCFSFNGNKLITTGGGGMIVTNNPDWAKRAKYLTTQAKMDSIEFIHGDIGYNYRLTNLQAAMGVAQMETLHDYVDAKRRIAATYDQAIRTIPGVTPMQEARWADSSFWMYTVLIDENHFGMNSRSLLRALQKRNIQSRPLWQPIHLSPAHKAAVRLESYPVAENLYQNALSLPCSVGLSPEQQNRVIDALTSSHIGVSMSESVTSTC